MVQDRRADPDDLLAGIKEENGGRLTVFLGAAAGVGKTYAMLEAAREKLAEGVEMVAGWVEPHARPETLALLEGLPSIPPRALEYRGKTLVEMDLDAILKRRPKLVLVDELAHTNAPGARHMKRYQDVEELLAAGIDVYTTLNVQHVESFKDIVAQITGVKVRESVPDQVLEKARLQLVDIPPEELIQRLQEGKVYVPDQAVRAIKNFFRPGNINALRELSMRFTAQRVDRQLETYMRAHGIAGPWPAGERVMVCISPSPFSERLIRFGRRIAVGLRAELLVVYVETPRRLPATEKEKNQLAKNMHLAQELNAETISIGGGDVAEELLEIARRRNVTQIIIGKPGKYGFLDRLQGSVIDKVVRRSQNVSVHVIPGDLGPQEEAVGTRSQKRRPSFPFGRYLGVLLLMLLVTLAGHWLEPAFGVVNIAMLYLLPVLFAAVKWGLKPAVAASVLGLMAFDFFFIPPTLSFTVHDFRYLITFAIFLLVGLLTGKLSTRLREQVKHARKREIRTAALYALSREITAVGSLDRVLQSVARKVSETMEGQVIVLLPDETGGLMLRACSNSENACRLLDDNERAVATWVFEHGEMAGKGTDTLGGSSGCYLPLKAERQTCGVLGIRFNSPERYLQDEQQRLLEAFSGLVAVAVTRISLEKEAREARLLNESEKLRTALLNSISHDLRTPLASMIGAVSSLLEGEEIYGVEARRDLLQTIHQGAVRMNRLVNNILDMARLESGMLQLHKEWCDIEDIIGVAVRRLGEPLRTRTLHIDIGRGIPLIHVDFVLIEQVVVNLLDNALKYSKPDSEILLAVHSDKREVEVSVHDQGTLIPESDLERVFDKFYRINAPRQISGTGLGLAICKGIIDVHGGKIGAKNERDGVTVRVVLPLEKGAPGKIPLPQGVSARGDE
ncbi:sensor protein KdpD [Peptococcaceae bacterium CEB3]|nr:sensor protein KdpD [Peptococcaceae bacterium CEB3]